MRRVLLSVLLLMALSGCVSKPVVQQCAPMEPFPAELVPEPQNLNLLLDKIITVSDEQPTSSSQISSSAGRN